MAELLDVLTDINNEYFFFIIIALWIVMMGIIMRMNRRMGLGQKLVFGFAFPGLYVVFLTVYGADGLDVLGKWEEEPTNIVWILLMLIPISMSLLMWQTRKQK